MDTLPPKSPNKSISTAARQTPAFAPAAAAAPPHANFSLNNLNQNYPNIQTGNLARPSAMSGGGGANQSVSPISSIASLPNSRSPQSPTSELPASFFSTNIHFDDFGHRKRYQTDSFAMLHSHFDYSNPLNDLTADPLAYSSNIPLSNTNLEKSTLHGGSDEGKRIHRLRASSISSTLSPFNAQYSPSSKLLSSSVWGAPLHSPDHTPNKPFDFALPPQRFAPAVEESDDTSALVRTIGYLGIGGDKQDLFANESRQRSITVSYPSTATKDSFTVGGGGQRQSVGDEWSNHGTRAISSMAVMTESFDLANNKNSFASSPPSTVQDAKPTEISTSSWQELIDKFQASNAEVVEKANIAASASLSSPTTSTPLTAHSASPNHRRHSTSFSGDQASQEVITSRAVTPTPKEQDTQNIHTPSRSLWIGNIDATQSHSELWKLFGAFGPIESTRILPEKDCAFINFVHLEDALRAKEKMQGSRIGNCVIRIGFGKLETNDTNQGNQPTKSLWVGNILPSVKPADLEKVFSKFGAVESARILTHKNCGFVNFLSLDRAIEARQKLNGKDIGGSIVKIGFAKVPAAQTVMTVAQALSNPSVLAAVVPGALERLEKQSAWKNNQTSATTESNLENVNESNMYYSTDYTPVLPIPDLRPTRKQDQNRLREVRKKLESIIPMSEIDQIYNEIIEDAADLCSDYIGNVVIQKLMEKSPDHYRFTIIQKIAPQMAALGIHKNGTWAVQKIIDITKNQEHIQVIVEALRPYATALLLDQFGNYVIQCCLRLGSVNNQFIFDAITCNIWEIGQGRFGARATKACLESNHSTKEQQKQVSLAIVQNCVQLSMNSNGTILLSWLLEVSVLPGRYRVLAPIMNPHINVLACHKLASLSILKIINQRIELDARDLMILELTKKENLAFILADQLVGIPLMTKILSSCCINNQERDRVVASIKQCLSPVLSQSRDIPVNYKRLMEEMSVGFEDHGSKGGAPGLDSLSVASAATTTPTTIKNNPVNTNNTGNSYNRGGYVLPTPSQSPQHYYRT